MTDSEKLLALADEIHTGPSGDRQKAIANELRTIAALPVPVPTPSRKRRPARATKSPPAKAPRKSGYGRGRSN